MSDTKISLLPLATSINDADMGVVVQSGTTKRSLWSTIKSYILGGKTLGGSAVGDVTVNNAIQTLTNKTLTNPREDTPNINEAVQCYATSTEINKLHNLPTTATELGYVNGARSNLQAQIDNKVDVNTIANVNTLQSFEFTSTGSNKTISEADLLNGVTGYYVHHGLQVSLYKYYDNLQIDIFKNAAISVFKRETHSQTHLKDIEINSLDAGNYLAVVSYKLIVVSGGV